MEEYAREVFPVEEAANGLTWMEEVETPRREVELDLHNAINCWLLDLSSQGEVQAPYQYPYSNGMYGSNGVSCLAEQLNQARLWYSPLWDLFTFHFHYWRQRQHCGGVLAILLIGILSAERALGMKKAVYAW
jgi:hypothetical protein